MPRLYARVRPQAGYRQSLDVLITPAEAPPADSTKRTNRRIDPARYEFDGPAKQRFRFRMVHDPFQLTAETQSAQRTTDRNK